MLTPTANQSRLSYLVDIVVDNCQKCISKAVNLQIRKDATTTTFVAEVILTDIRGIGRYLGAQALKNVTRHRCGNDERSCALLGAVDPNDFETNDRCP